jgi:alkaline phosphatase
MKKLPILAASLSLAASMIQAQVDYTLQVLHASDLEGGTEAIRRAPNFAALIEYFENNTAADGTVLLSAGDNTIPGPFYNAASDSALRSYFQQAYQDLFNEPGLTNIREGNGRVDITVMNIVGFDAAAIGNHEFDLGSEAFASIIQEDVRGTSLGDLRWLGAQFPYLSSNLDFSGDAELSGLFTSDIYENSEFALTPSQAIAGNDPFKIAQATIIDVDGEKIGVVGATTQRLNIISSPSGTLVIGTNQDDIALLASQLQPVIDAITKGPDGDTATADDINKIILVSHLQQLALETQLAALLSGVDVIIAGGSDTLLADGDDTLRAGDSAEGTYPVVVSDLNSKNTLIVSTDGEYSYLGRLNVPFDANGDVLVADLVAANNGPVATTDSAVINTWGDLATAFAAGTKGQQVQDLITPVETTVATQDGNVFGYTAVFLDGARSEVRTEETNLGNLTADANLAAAQLIDPTTVISIKNGGGLRSIIGQIDGITGELLPPAANPSAVPAKPAGAISELDIANSARFNNKLTLLDLSVADLVSILEYGYSDSFEGNTPGRFAQVGGMHVAFTPPTESTAVAIDSIALVDFDGTVTEVLYKDRQFVADPNRELRIVTLNFLAGGGDGYDFPSLASNEFETTLGEQEALQQYLQENFATTATAYSAPERDATFDTRVQNMAIRYDTVGINAPVEPAGALRLTPVATYESGIFDDSAAEISTYDAASQRIFTVSSAGSIVRVLDASAPETNGLPQINSIAAPFVDFVPNSVDHFSGALGNAIAVAWADDSGTAGRGIVTLHDPDTLAQIGSNITVGFLPDMLTFTPDGNRIVVANEGEIVGSTNPEGSVSIIDFSGSYSNATHTEVGFDRWNRRENILRARGIFFTQIDTGNAATIAEDLEPEYVTVTADSNYAWVSLQENNAVALIDLHRKALRNILPLGLVNHSNPNSILDASDKDDGINLTTEPIFGMRQPDAIALMTYNGQDYLFTANEGDARDFEELRFKDVGDSGEPDFDSAATVISALQADDELGRLEFNKIASDLDQDGDIDELLTFGGRSMTIFQAPVVGQFRAVRDTDSDLESYTASRFANVFNSNNDDNDSFESRSDSKGGEPEALTLAEIDGKTYAFLGLERQSAIMVYDVSNPLRPAFQDYASNRSYVDDEGNFLDVETTAGLSATGDLGPEGIEFIPAADSPIAGVPMIAVSNEVSGTVTLWRIDLGL